MLKALLKKQFMELFRGYYVNRKNGQAIGRGRRTMLFVLFGVLLVFLCACFFTVGMGICEPLVQLELSWLYFALMGLISMLLGIIGSVFNTYASLYLSKDNDLLLSMPIPPRIVLLSRLVSVLGLALLYSGVVWIPALVAYRIAVGGSIRQVLLGIFLWPVLGLFVSVLTCALGWLVALIASRAKNKNILVVFLSLAFFGLYYTFILNSEKVFSALLENIATVGNAVQTWGNTLYQLGRGAAGSIAGTLIFTLVSAASAGVCFFVMERTFLFLTPRQKTAGKKAGKGKCSRQDTVAGALLKKEWKRFFSSSAYMLNCGFGLVMMIVLTAIVVVKRNALQTALNLLTFSTPLIAELMPLILVGIVSLVAATVTIAEPSVSLEGKNLWLLKSMPVRGSEILLAKLRLHLIPSIPIAGVCTAVLGLCVGMDVRYCLMAVAACALQVWLQGLICLVIGVRHANFHWTSEIQPIKQSISLPVVMLLGMIASLIVPGIGFLLRNNLPIPAAFAAGTAVVLMADLLLERYIRKSGDKLYAAL